MHVRVCVCVFIAAAPLTDFYDQTPERTTEEDSAKFPLVGADYSYVFAAVCAVVSLSST